jgi:hypothetical protein
MVFLVVCRFPQGFIDAVLATEKEQRSDTSWRTFAASLPARRGSQGGSLSV